MDRTKEEYFQSDHWKKTCNWIYKICPNKDDAEDICQYVAMQLFRGRKGAAKNIVIDYYRQHYGDMRRGEVNKMNVNLGNYSELLNEGVSDTYGHIDIKLILDKLTPVERDQLTLRLAGWDLADIGKIYGVGTVAACQYIKAIIRKIRRMK